MGYLAPTEYAIKPRGRCIVRSAAPADAPRVLAGAREVFATSDYTLTKFDEFSITLEQERDMITALAEHPRQLFLIAIDADEPAGADDAPVIGITVLKQNTARRKLRHSVELGMSVTQPYRGRGVGTALMRAAVDWAVAQPELELITLDVYAVNEPGVRLYRGQGFVESGRMPDGLIHDDGSMWEQIKMYRRVGRGQPGSSQRA